MTIKMILFACVCVAMLTGVYAGGGDLATQPCEPGDTIRQQCNTCTCALQGDGYQCTKNICQTLHARKTRETIVDCVPGKSFKKECNTCRCSSDGRSAACTQKFCIHRDTRAINCDPGKLFKKECNSCRCGSDGRSATCTQKFCIRRDKRDRKENGRS